MLLFYFLSYSVPIYGAYVADVQLGRYKTIMIGTVICGVAHIVLIAGAAPSVLQAGKGMAPFLIGFFMLAFGAGESTTALRLSYSNINSPHRHVQA